MDGRREGFYIEIELSQPLELYKTGKKHRFFMCFVKGRGATSLKMSLSDVLFVGLHTLQSDKLVKIWLKV
jgi:hypothetical protein